MRYLKYFEAYEEPLDASSDKYTHLNPLPISNIDREEDEKEMQINALRAIKGIKEEDIEAATKYNIYMGFNKGLEIAEIFHGPIQQKYNTSDDPSWPVWTAQMQDGTRLGWMFEDGYWEKENR